MHIRLATIIDLEDLTQLDKETSITPWSYSNYLSSFNNQHHHIYVLANLHNILGSIVVSLNGTEAEILQLWIAKEYQNHGHATSLVTDIVSKLHKQKVQQLFLEVRSDNTKAVKLYEKLGFTQVGIRKNYYKLDSWYFDALVMLKNLAT